MTLFPGSAGHPSSSGRDPLIHRVPRVGREPHSLRTSFSANPDPGKRTPYPVQFGAEASTASAVVRAAAVSERAGLTASASPSPYGTASSRLMVARDADIRDAMARAGTVVDGPHTSGLLLLEAAKSPAPSLLSAPAMTFSHAKSVRFGATERQAIEAWASQLP